MEFVPDNAQVDVKSFQLFRGEKKLVFCFVVSYVQVFIVITKLARAAQPGDITFTPGPCSMIPRSLFESEFRLLLSPLAPGSQRSLPGRPTQQNLNYLEKIKAEIEKIVNGNQLGVLESWEIFERSKGYSDNLTVSIPPFFSIANGNNIGGSPWRRQT